MTTQDKKLFREEAISELNRELKMRIRVWPQERALDSSGPKFKAQQHQRQYQTLDGILRVVEALSPEEYFNLWWAAEPFKEPGQAELF